MPVKIGLSSWVIQLHKIGPLWIRNSFPKMTTSEEESADKPALKCFCSSRQDVIHLAPKAVVILAGTNDIAGNTGPTSIDMIMDNIKSMTELAQANQIKVVLCSVLPANRYGWSPEVQPADTIIALNELIKDYARSKRLVYVDFYTALVDEQKGLNPNYGRDSVHPNLDGYKVMEPLVVKGIKRALSRP